MLKNCDAQSMKQSRTNFESNFISWLHGIPLSENPQLQLFRVNICLVFNVLPLRPAFDIQIITVVFRTLYFKFLTTVEL